MKTVEELYNDYKKACEEYGVESNESIKRIINDRVEYIKSRKDELYYMAKTSLQLTDKKYPKYAGIFKVNTIIKKFDKVHIHMLVIWDNLLFYDFVIYPLVQE